MKMHIIQNIIRVLSEPNSEEDQKYLEIFVAAGFFAR